MASDKHCCVPGCKTPEGISPVMHGFPNPEKDRDRFNAWLYAIGVDVSHLDNEHIYKYRRVCRSHFEVKYLCRYNRISNIAVPTLNLQGVKTATAATKTVKSKFIISIEEEHNKIVVASSICEPLVTTPEPAMGLVPVKQKAPRQPSKKTYGSPSAQDTGRAQHAEKRSLNSFMSLRSDYKKQKVEKPSRATAASYNTAISSDLKVAVTSAGPEYLTNAMATSFIKKIMQSMLDIAWTPDGGDTMIQQMPVFATKPFYFEGAIRITCENQMTLTWLKKMVEDPQMSQGRPLTVKQQDELPRRVRCSIFVPDEYDIIKDTRDIGQFIYRQNQWVQVKEWLVLNGEKQKDGWFINLTIPETQIPTLLERNGRLACAIYHCKIKFLNEGDKHFKTPQTKKSGQRQPCTIRVDAPTTHSTVEHNNRDRITTDPLVNKPGPSGLRKTPAPFGGKSLRSLLGAAVLEDDDAEVLLAGLNIDEEEEDIKERLHSFPFVE